MTTPRIACIAVIGKKNSPLHLSTFTDNRDALSFHFLVHTTLDMFASRLPAKTNGDSDFGLLYAVDDEVALYGWLTNTGIKFVIAVETPAGAEGDGGVGVREGELKGVFKALQTAYITLVCNPFYDNDETRPIESRRFLSDVKRIAESWRPNVKV
ncbi:Sedlin [Wilcoxina mikolae CBS 423.85]|nr:Sedlin [Wilcoxina mikolae CBS 423.85]